MKWNIIAIYVVKLKSVLHSQFLINLDKIWYVKLSTQGTSHTKSYQDRFRNKKVFSCVSLLLWKRAWSNGVCKMSHFEAGSRNFTARKLIFGYFVVQSILSKSYYRHFSIRPFICMRDGLKDEESVPPCCGLLYLYFTHLRILGLFWEGESVPSSLTSPQFELRKGVLLDGPRTHNQLSKLNKTILRQTLNLFPTTQIHLHCVYQ